MLSRTNPPANLQPSSTAFEISQHGLDSSTSVISVTGELDLSTAPRLKWTLLDALESGLSQLVVDLTPVSFIDSTALGVLVGVKRRLEGEQRLALVCTQTSVLRIFEFSGIDGVFAIFPTLDEALASVRGRAAQSG